MAKIINGKEVSKKVRESVKAETEKLKAQGIVPGLAVVIVGDDPASRVYVNNKKKACAEVVSAGSAYSSDIKPTSAQAFFLLLT